MTLRLVVVLLTGAACLPAPAAALASAPPKPASPSAAASATAARSAAGKGPVAQFHAPRRFWCMTSYPEQAQVTVGWSVPRATGVTVALDGKPLRAGIRPTLPFHVLAGPPSGIGTTVVFPCASGDTHTITVRWRRGDRQLAKRTVHVRKAVGA